MLSMVRLTNASNTAAVEIPTSTLSNGIEIPLVGLGCASGVRKEHVLTALQAGYRYLDTAQAHQWGYHEEEVAEAILESTDVTRQDVFVVTKIHPENLGYVATHHAVQESLNQPGFEGYLDAVLIHKPRCWEGACKAKPDGTWQESWKALEELYDTGLVRAIGICDVDHGILDELLEQRIQPHIIQNWYDPFYQQDDLRERIQKHHILFQAYSSLGTQWKMKGLDKNPVLANVELITMAKEYQVPGPAQVVINWLTHKGISVLPASTNAQRQSQNLFTSFSFELSKEDMKWLDNLDGKAPHPSRPHRNEVSVTWSNPSDYTVNIFWLDVDRKEVAVGSIQPNQDVTMKTFDGHTFVFRTAGEMLSEQTISREEGQTQTIVVVEMEDEL